MECTRRRIINVIDNKKRFYYNTVYPDGPDERVIIKWLSQQGVIFYRAYGTEMHDIGDTDWFQGGIYTDDVNAIQEFVRKIFGSWIIDATYKGIDISIGTSLPDISESLCFIYPKEHEETILSLFEGFEKMFCFPEIESSEEDWNC